MLVFKSVSALQNHINKLISERKIIGFVPTMGALHAGHLSLVEKSLLENDCTIVSVFVNPTQFNNSNDLNTYPSNIIRDKKLLQSLDNEIVLFHPNSKEIYSGELKSDHFDFDNLDQHMEGKYREGHFQGVATVVNKLLLIVKSDKIYFGEKDFQQLRIIENLVFAKKINTKVIRCNTIRQDDGLALSSRNNKLDISSKKTAKYLFKALSFAKENFDTLDITNIEEKVNRLLAKFPQIKLDYFVIADERHLQPTLKRDNKKKYRAFIAADISGVRLIDNIKLY